MSELTRDSLKAKFADGERPSGTDFANLIDSFVNKPTDGVSFDADGNLVLTRGVRLGDSAGTVAGGLRFNSNQLQVFTGGAWVNVASGGGGGGSRSPPPTTRQSAGGPRRQRRHRHLSRRRCRRSASRCTLGANSGAGEQVRFGNVVCANGSRHLCRGPPSSPIGITRRTPTSRCGRRPTAPCTSTPRPGRSSAFVRAARPVRLRSIRHRQCDRRRRKRSAGAPAAAILQVDGGAFKNDGPATGRSPPMHASRRTCAISSWGCPSCARCGRCAFVTTDARARRRVWPASACSARRSRRSFPRRSSASQRCRTIRGSTICASSTPRR